MQYALCKGYGDVDNLDPDRNSGIYSVGSLNYGENFVDISPCGDSYNYINFRSSSGWRDGYCELNAGAMAFTYWHDMPSYTSGSFLVYTVMGGTTLYDQHGNGAINLKMGDAVYCDSSVGCDAMPGHTDRIRVTAFYNNNGFCYAPYGIGYVDTGIAGAVADNKPLVRGNW